MRRISLDTTDGGTFEVTSHEPPEATRVVLFMAGAGGSPERHAPLLDALAQRGLAVIAPHFERLATPRPTESELLGRMDRVRAALDTLQGSRPLFGAGHSIGATLLLGSAGATMWLGPDTRVALPRLAFEQLVLMAPPVGFFAAPHALDTLEIPDGHDGAGPTKARILLWSGGSDTLTPASSHERIRVSLGAKVDLRVVEGATHFTFMHLPPPHIRDDVDGRDSILERITRESCDFLRNAT